MHRLLRLCATLLLTAGCSGGASAQSSTDVIRARVQAVLDSVHSSGRFAGATAGVVLRDGSSLGFAVGESDTVAGIAMQPHDRMLAGSTGKTFFGALALQLAAEGSIALDDPLSKYLGTEPWWKDGTGAASPSIRSSSGPAAGTPPLPRTLPAGPKRSTRAAPSTPP
jgi:D-alanyl-D-alanine carboxypeptidase